MTDTDARALTRPPMPTWHGFGVNLEGKYREFIRREMERNLQAKPRQLAEEISRVEGNLTASQERLVSLRSEKEEVQTTALRGACRTRLREDSESFREGHLPLAWRARASMGGVYCQPAQSVSSFGRPSRGDFAEIPPRRPGRKPPANQS